MRRLLGVVALLGLGLGAGCGGDTAEPAPPDTRPLVAEGVGSGRLTARPTPPATRDTATGWLPLVVNGEERGVLFVPPHAAQENPQPMPLLLLLHFSGGEGIDMARIYEEPARAVGAVLVAPSAYTPSWELADTGEYGADRALVDGALAHVFSRYLVDPKRVGITGYSAGATYALSLGLTNGDLFNQVAAFAPRDLYPSELVGKPPVYVVHGAQDRIVPVTQSRDHTVPRLRAAGYLVEYREFAGGHEMDPALTERGFGLWLNNPAP